MAKPSVMIIGGGLAGHVRRHETGRTGMRRQPHERPAGETLAQRLRQGGINSVNDLTRQLGDSEWKHFDDTVYGGDFLQHSRRSRSWPTGPPRSSTSWTGWA